MKKLKRSQEIKPGSRVRSFDFFYTEDCYVEGTVRNIVLRNGCKRYQIKVEKKVWAGKEVKHPYMGYVYPPINGTHLLDGRPASGVFLI